MSVITVGSGHTSGPISVGTGVILDVQQGASAFSVTIASGGEADIFGAASFITAAGVISVFTNGSTETATVSGSGAREAIAGGSALATTIESGGSQSVASGGTVFESVLSGGGTLDLLPSGTAVNTVVGAGGLLTNEAGQSSETTIESGGFLTVTDEGVGFNSLIERGGSETVQFGGQAGNDTIAAGGVVSVTGQGLNPLLFAVRGENVESGGLLLMQAGSAQSDEVLSGGTEIFWRTGEIFIEDTIAAGGTIGESGLVLSGAGAEVTLAGVTGGEGFRVSGAAIVSSGLVETLGATISGGAVLLVSVGGTDSGSMIGNGGSETVSSGGRSVQTQVLPGGSMLVRVGGHADFISVAGGGAVQVSSGGVFSGGVLAAAAVVTVSAGGSAFDTTLSGGVLALLSGAVGGGGIAFAGGGTVFADTTALAGATISGFASGDTIGLTDVAFNSSGTAAPDGANPHQLDVVVNGATYELLFAGSLTGETFGLSEGLQGTDIVLQCFLAGTAIATPAGETAVERLQPGDLVCTADGPPQPVRFVGVQTVATRFADPLHTRPVRIRAGALADGVPTRDLLVSPGHALLLDGVLVQAGALVNGISIVRESVVAERLSYLHVELDQPALLLAHAAAAESFCAGIEPVAFDNAADRPAHEEPAPLPYPRTTAARQVPAALRERLAMRAAARYPARAA